MVGYLIRYITARWDVENPPSRWWLPSCTRWSDIICMTNECPRGGPKRMAVHICSPSLPTLPDTSMMASMCWSTPEICATVMCWTQLNSFQIVKFQRNSHYKFSKNSADILDIPIFNCAVFKKTSVAPYCLVYKNYYSGPWSSLHWVVQSSVFHQPIGV